MSNEDVSANPATNSLRMRAVLFSSVNFFSVVDAENNDLLALHVEDYAIIADTKPITTKFRIGQRYHFYHFAASVLHTTPAAYD